MLHAGDKVGQTPSGWSLSRSEILKHVELFSLVHAFDLYGNRQARLVYQPAPARTVMRVSTDDRRCRQLAVTPTEE